MKLELAEMLLQKKGIRGRAGEVAEIAGLVSVGTGRRYPMTMVSVMWRVPRSTVYAQQAAQRSDARIGSERHDHEVGRGRSPLAPGAKRGPRTLLDDAALLEEIRAVLQASRFCTEGHRKVHARLRPRGICVGKKRVLRLMRAHRLLAPPSLIRCTASCYHETQQPTPQRQIEQGSAT